MVRRLTRFVLVAGLALAPAAAESSLYDKLASELVAPCCWKEALSSHRSPAADEARAELRALIQEGRSEPEIRQWFVDKYGERVLITPPGMKAMALIWAPILVAIAGAAAAVVVLRKWTARRAAAVVGPAFSAPDDDSEWDW